MNDNTVMADVKKTKQDVKRKLMPIVWEKGWNMKTFAGIVDIRYDMLCGKINGYRPFNEKELKKISKVLGIKMFIDEESKIIIRRTDGKEKDNGESKI